MNLLFGFEGRIGRGQWWLGQLAIFLMIFVGLIVIAVAIGGPIDPEDIENGEFPSGSVRLAILAMLALAIWINVATSVKRFHDRGKSGWWFLIVFVPYLGTLWQLVECGFLAGTEGGNAYDAVSSGRYHEPDFDPRPAPRMSANRSGYQPSQAYESLSRTETPREPPTPGAVPVRRPTGPVGFGKRGR